MELEFWGVRGVVPVSAREKLKYGGQTTCSSLVCSSGEILIIDAGSGIKGLGEKLVAGNGEEPLHLHLLLTHFHLDHIIGLPFFSPLYSAGVRISFYSPYLPQEMQRYLGGLMMGRYFPLTFNETASAKEFVRLDEESYSIGKVEISYCPLHHPQGSVAYRVEEGGSSVVFATDTEQPEEGMDARLATFSRRASCLIYDSTFTPEEYRKRQGWGHSTWVEGTMLAREAKVRSLFLSHLNPDHTDRQVDEMVRQAKQEFSRTRAAREGLKLQI